jgi:uncharacterized protein YaaQ
MSCAPPGTDLGGERAMKLCIIIIPEVHERRLLEHLAELDLGATSLDSRGGFSGRRVACVMSAMEDTSVQRLSAMLHREFPDITEPMTAQAVTHADTDAGGADMVDVRVHGAVMMVLPLDRLVRT